LAPAPGRPRHGRRAAGGDLGRRGRRAGVPADRAVRPPVPRGTAGRADRLTSTPLALFVTHPPRPRPRHVTPLAVDCRRVGAVGPVFPPCTGTARGTRH